MAGKNLKYFYFFRVFFVCLRNDITIYVSSLLQHITIISITRLKVICYSLRDKQYIKIQMHVLLFFILCARKRTGYIYIPVFNAVICDIHTAGFRAVVVQPPAVNRTTRDEHIFHLIYYSSTCTIYRSEDNYRTW